ncbi:hypothetical protein C0Q70_03080 [Pomacea canaliculata]|uniref:G-protein coupled receptors family 1 profile domain-containing protein n=1 Tax=Pomacea canaliculata TaxID=400727 RepID=A0A2T7PRV5_POMCA|nr:hypothetical protein C0Q70_03080 [Pomacea canaliculata]
MDQIWSFVDFLVFSLVPFIILLVSNIVLLRTVMTSVRELRRRLDLGDTQQMTSRKKAASSMTTTLLALSFTFLILTGPICVYLLLTPYVFDDIDKNYEKEAVRRLLPPAKKAPKHLVCTISYLCLHGLCSKHPPTHQIVETLTDIKRGMFSEDMKSGGI